MNLSDKDVADLLNVSEKTIYRMIKDETIPCFRVGGQWRFDRREISSWIEDTREFRYDAAVKDSSRDDETIIIAELLGRGGIHYDVPGDSREAAVMSYALAMLYGEVGCRALRSDLSLQFFFESSAMFGYPKIQVCFAAIRKLVI